MPEAASLASAPALPSVGSRTNGKFRAATKSRQWRRKPPSSASTGIGETLSRLHLDGHMRQVVEMGEPRPVGLGRRRRTRSQRHDGRMVARGHLPGICGGQATVFPLPHWRSHCRTEKVGCAMRQRGWVADRRPSGRSPGKETWMAWQRRGLERTGSLEARIFRIGLSGVLCQVRTRCARSRFGAGAPYLIR